MSTNEKKMDYALIPYKELVEKCKDFIERTGSMPSRTQYEELEELSPLERQGYISKLKQKEAINMGTTPNYQKKEKEYEERKATRGMEEQQLYETDLDFRVRVDAAIESRRMEDAHKDNLEKQEKKRNQLDAEEKDKRERILAEEGFTGETELHKQIRLKLYAGGIPEEERQKLREQYHLTPYEMPYTQTFSKTIILDYGEGLQIVSTDNGKHWSPRADIKYFKGTPRLELDPVTGKPTAYIFDNFNNSIYGFIRTTQPSRVKILLEEDTPVEPKITVPKTESKKYNCSDQGLNHTSIDGGKTCCICGAIMGDKEK